MGSPHLPLAPSAFPVSHEARTCPNRARREASRRRQWRAAATSSVPAVFLHPRNLGRPNLDQGLGIELTPSHGSLAKEPLVFFKNRTRRPLRIPKFLFSSFKSVFRLVDFKNTFSAIYSFATDFVLAITCPF